MIKHSMVDVAFEILSNRKSTDAIGFNKLWEDVSTSLSMSVEEGKKKVSSFYTQLILDGRFVTLGENTWDLRSRHTFDKVHIDMNDIYNEEEEIVEDDIVYLEEEIISVISEDDVEEEEEEKQSPEEFGFVEEKEEF